MSEMVQVVLEARAEKGKEACKKMRPAYTPCVVYGPDYRESVPAKVKTSDIAKIANSGYWETQTLNLTIPGGKQEMCLMREVQKDHLTGRILHIDFLQLVKGHKLTVNVPVELKGRDECKGVKLGGVIDMLLREVAVEVIPSQIPDSFHVDVSSLGLGSQFHVRDLTLPEGVEVLADPDEVIVAVVVPRGVSEEEEAEAAAAEEKEVEVVAKGKAKEAEEEE